MVRTLRVRWKTRPGCPVEGLVLGVSIWWLVSANAAFFAAVDAAQPGASFVFHAALAVILVALHYVAFVPFAYSWTAKPLLSAAIVATAIATFFMNRYGVHFDTEMLRNVLHTDVREARELLATPALVPHLGWQAVVPLVVLWWVRIRPWPTLLRASVARVGSMIVACALAATALLAASASIASLIRNHKPVRSLATPANLVYALGAAAAPDLRRAARPLQPIGLDARPGPAMAARQRPFIVVVVVGETVRAANWGLAGYARQTTPQLARLPVIAFNDTTACGTSTEVSLPCLFAPVGRRDYNESRIRGHESLFDVARRAGVDAAWVDNQSGCKGICDRVRNETLACADGPCLDEKLIASLDAFVAAQSGTGLLALHMMGNHGPAYFRRYPPAFERFVPACKEDDLQRCSREAVVAAYDNAVLYTDHVLARLIDRLAAATDRVDSMLLYVSDHGESLGEHGLWLHGMPWSIAPDVQKKVPMLIWLSRGAATTVDAACLSQRAAQPAQHDDVFHTLLGALDVRTTLYAPERDLLSACRRPAGSAAGSS